MNKGFVIILLPFLLLSNFAVDVKACDPPDCGDCQSWNGVNCVYYCTQCDSCVNDSCISTCTACEKCVYDSGWTCVNDCPDCKDCVNGYCEGGCDVCYECVEWSPGYYDCVFCDVNEVCCATGCEPECSRSDPTNDCNDSLNSQCPGCGLCGSYTTTVYSDNLIYTCSGGCPGDCEYDDVYCSTEYYCEGWLWPCYWCEGDPKACNYLDCIVGCIECYQDIDVKQVNYVSSGSCN